MQKKLLPHPSLPSFPPFPVNGLPPPAECAKNLRASLPLLSFGLGPPAATRRRGALYFWGQLISAGFWVLSRPRPRPLLLSLGYTLIAQGPAQPTPNLPNLVVCVIDPPSSPPRSSFFDYLPFINLCRRRRPPGR